MVKLEKSQEEKKGDEKKKEEEDNRNRFELYVFRGWYRYISSLRNPGERDIKPRLLIDKTM